MNWESAARQYVEDCCNLELLYQKTKECIDNGLSSDWVLLEILSNGVNGTYQVEDLLDMFGIEWEEEESRWEVVWDFTDVLAEVLTEIMKVEYGIDGIYCFDSESDSGDFCLYYRDNKKEV